MAQERIPQTIRFSNIIFEKLNNIADNDHTSINSVVNRIIDEYFEYKPYIDIIKANNIDLESFKVSEPNSKYTINDYNKAKTDPVLLDEILANSPYPEVRLLFEKINKIEKQKGKK